MKYLLILGIEFRKEFGPTILRIFSDEIMIDEVLLEQPINLIDKDWIAYESYDETDDLMENKEKINHRSSKWSFPEKIFVYELDESILKNKIMFYINDRNSNYNNGFMTKSNMIKFNNIILLPKSYLKYKNLPIFFKFLKSKYNSKNFVIYDNTHVSWPSVSYIHDTHTKFDENHDFKNHGNIGVWHGGRKILYCNIKKKFGVYFLGDTPAFKISKPIEFIQYNHFYRLINRINEDQ